MLASDSAAPTKNNRPPITVRGLDSPLQNWANFLAGGERPLAIIDLTNREQHNPSRHQEIWEIFGCASNQLFVVKPLQGKISQKDLSALETVVMLEGLRTLAILLDAPSSVVPPPGYERLIWHIDPEYCGQQHQQALLKTTTEALGRSRYLKKMWTQKQLEVLTANYNRQTGAIERAIG